jgi:hypothetical protein
MAVTMLFPGLKSLANSLYDIHYFRDVGIVKAVFRAYAEGDLLKAAILTFTVNFFYVCILLTLLPSLIIRSLGVVLIMIRAFLWGAMFAPFGVEKMIFLPHMPTVLIEGLGYVVAAFGARLHGIMVSNPREYGFTSTKEAFAGALRAIGPIYLLAAAILAVMAGYEGYEVIHLVPLFVHAAPQ